MPAAEEGAPLSSRGVAGVVLLRCVGRFDGFVEVIGRTVRNGSEDIAARRLCAIVSCLATRTLAGLHGLPKTSKEPSFFTHWSAMNACWMNRDPSRSCDSNGKFWLVSINAKWLSYGFECFGMRSHDESNGTTLCERFDLSCLPQSHDALQRAALSM